jgi:hypothetical protein
LLKGLFRDMSQFGLARHKDSLDRKAVKYCARVQLH